MKNIEEIKKLEQNFHAANTKFHNIKDKRKSLNVIRRKKYLPFIHLMHDAEKKAIEDSNIRSYGDKYRRTNIKVGPLCAPKTRENEFKITKSKFRNGFLRIKYRFEEYMGYGEYDQTYETVKIPMLYFDMNEEEITNTHYKWFMGICKHLISEYKNEVKRNKNEQEEKALLNRKTTYEKLKLEFES